MKREFEVGDTIIEIEVEISFHSFKEILKRVKAIVIGTILTIFSYHIIFSVVDFESLSLVDKNNLVFNFFVIIGVFSLISYRSWK